MKSWVPALGLFGIGFYIAACIVGGVLGGAWIDENFETQPLFIIIGIVLGIAVAALGIYGSIKPLKNRIDKGGKESE